MKNLAMFTQLKSSNPVIHNSMSTSRVYLLAMAIFWFVFGLITTFYPALMNMFQTEEGIKSATAFSDHVWLHDGLDILSVSVLLFAFSREKISRNLLRATAAVAFLVTLGITSSLLSTPYWNKLFLIPGACCLLFTVWGLRMAARTA